MAVSDSQRLLNDAVKHYENGVILDTTHVANPHEVHYTQILGLWNLDNTSDANKPVSNALLAEMDTKFSVSDIYNQLEADGNDEAYLASVPLSAAQGKNLADTIAGLSNIDQTVAEYATRISDLETAFGIS